MVPQDVFDAFYQYFTAAKAQVRTLADALLLAAPSMGWGTAAAGEQAGGRSHGTSAAPALQLAFPLPSLGAPASAPSPRAQVMATTRFAITPCNASVVCGSNVPQSDHACYSIRLPPSAPNSLRNAARATLMSM